MNKKLATAFALFLILPGAHRKYLRQSGWWYFLVISVLSIIALMNGRNQIFQIGLIAYICLFAWDSYWIPEWVNGEKSSWNWDAFVSELSLFVVGINWATIREIAEKFGKTTHLPEGAAATRDYEADEGPLKTEDIARLREDARQMLPKGKVVKEKSLLDANRNDVDE